MAFEPEFFEFMNELVTIESYLYMNAKKEKVYDTPTTYRARVSGKIVSLRRPGNEDAGQIMDVWIYAGTTRITVQDRLTLPDQPLWVDRTPIIFAVGRYTDDQGQHNVKVQCGWMYHRQGQ